MDNSEDKDVTPPKQGLDRRAFLKTAGTAAVVRRRSAVLRRWWWRPRFGRAGRSASSAPQGVLVLRR